MAASENSLPKTLRALFLAMLNATLILVALCLWFAWQTFSSFGDLTSGIAAHIHILKPVREDVQQMTTEIAALRAQLSDEQLSSVQLDELTKQRILSNLARYDERLTSALAVLNQVKSAPSAIFDHTLAAVADEITNSAAQIKGCVPAPSPES